MGARFDSSLGAFRLLQWNARELELTVRLYLRKLMQTVEPNSREARTAQTRRWRAGAVAIIATSVGLGYVAGRTSTPHHAPISSASAEVTMDASSAPEGVGPSAWAQHVDALQGAFRTPAEERSTAKPAIAPAVDSQPLNADEVREAQAWLNAFGFSSGPVDGLAGPQTMAAVKRYRIARQLDEEGGLDRPVLKHMRQQSGQ